MEDLHQPLTARLTDSGLWLCLPWPFALPPPTHPTHPLRCLPPHWSWPDPSDPSDALQWQPWWGALWKTAPTAGHMSASHLRRTWWLRLMQLGGVNSFKNHSSTVLNCWGSKIWTLELYLWFNARIKDVLNSKPAQTWYKAMAGVNVWQGTLAIIIPGPVYRSTLLFEGKPSAWKMQNLIFQSALDEVANPITTTLPLEIMNELWSSGCSFSIRTCFLDTTIGNLDIPGETQRVTTQLWGHATTLGVEGCGRAALAPCCQTTHRVPGIPGSRELSRGGSAPSSGVLLRSENNSIWLYDNYMWNISYYI